MRKRQRGKRNVRRVVVVVPSLFTLANLFFGFWSMVLAAQGDFYRASWWIVIAGIMDTLDGVSARVSKTGSAFGAELDSLVDLVSFGVAPGVLMFFLLFQGEGSFAWVFSYAFTVCVALRLARYNLHSGDEHGRHFSGLPSTAAGLTLAVYYPFTQTNFYQFQLASLPWSQIMIFLIIGLGVVMVSNVQYARLPRIGVRSARGLAGLGVHLIVLWFGVVNRDIFFFPLGIAYVGYGLGRWVVLGILERGDDDSEQDDKAAPLRLHDTERQPREAQ
ncbi:MAG: CDP-diacylglycerol--serine O-phosphatidyltransferase [Gemmatimonadetes bacterium]|nr:CDP-diacylglycerol--serine O-phosphatidyltransferase [Gemmatimonadota bacterium]